MAKTPLMNFMAIFWKAIAYIITPMQLKPYKKPPGFNLHLKSAGLFSSSNTKNFRNTKWNISSKIINNNKVYYSNNRIFFILSSGIFSQQKTMHSYYKPFTSYTSSSSFIQRFSISIAKVWRTSLTALVEHYLPKAHPSFWKKTKPNQKSDIELVQHNRKINCISDATLLIK